jgi:hypothetical protein
MGLTEAAALRVIYALSRVNPCVPFLVELTRRADDTNRQINFYLGYIPLLSCLRTLSRSNLFVHRTIKQYCAPFSSSPRRKCASCHYLGGSSRCPTVDCIWPSVHPDMVHYVERESD